MQPESNVLDTIAERDATGRLKAAEESGLRLAIACRTLVAGLALIWYMGAGLVATFEPRLAGGVALAGFTAIGIAHLRVIGTSLDRWWLKYAVYAADILAICALFVLIPVSRAAEVPQIIAFRAYGIYYLFPVITMAALSLSWRLCLWSGLVAVIGWWSAFLIVAADIDTPLSWGDVPASATRGDYETVFLSIEFIGIGNRIEETGLLFAATGILAYAVYRARRVFIRHVEAEKAHMQEQEKRMRVAQALGRYVPAAVADQLIENEQEMAPQEKDASVLIMDIADFSKFASSRDPTTVIAALDSFLSMQADIVAEHRGVVISFTGDGLLAAFNTPVPLERYETQAVCAAVAMIEHAAETQFRIRVGVASGKLASGSVGSQNRQAFTIYGDTVNRAARLEECAKDRGQSLLMDEATVNALEDKIGFTRMATVSLRGLSEPVVAYGRSGGRQGDRPDLEVRQWK